MKFSIKNHLGHEVGTVETDGDPIAAYAAQVNAPSQRLRDAGYKAKPLLDPPCKSFLLLWHATNTWEWVENHEEGPHDYAWGHPQYGKSKYSFIPCETLPEGFEQTPEDALLDRIFNPGEISRKPDL